MIRAFTRGCVFTSLWLRVLIYCSCATLCSVLHLESLTSLSLSHTDAMFGYEEHSEELIQFLLKLDKLRRYSTEFLRMLNDMRRRLKELPADAPAAVSYRYRLCCAVIVCVEGSRCEWVVEWGREFVHLCKPSGQVCHCF